MSDTEAKAIADRLTAPQLSMLAERDRITFTYEKGEPLSKLGLVRKVPGNRPWILLPLGMKVQKEARTRPVTPKYGPKKKTA